MSHLRPQPRDMTRAELEAEVLLLRDRCSRYAQHATRRKAERAGRRYGVQSSVDARPLGVAIRQAGWNQITIARAIGVTRTAVSNWCMGKARCRRATAQEICRIFVAAGAEPPAFVFEPNQNVISDLEASP